MGPFSVQPNRSSYTGSDVVGGSEDDSVIGDKRAKKRLEFPCIIFPRRRVCGKNGRDLSP